MSLADILKARGYQFRQHLEEEGWGWFAPTVVDLDYIQLDVIKHGGIDALKTHLAAKRYAPPEGLFTYPSFDIEQPLPRHPDLILARQGHPAALVVAPRSHVDLWALAREWSDAIEAHYGIRLPVVDDTEATTTRLDDGPLVVFGGAHQNQLALALALRYRTLFVDAGVPGDDGWVVTTHCGLHASGHNVAQVAAPAAHRTTVLTLMADTVTAEGDTLVWRNIHRIQPGALMAAHFPSWETFTAGLPSRLPQFKDQQVEAPADLNALADLLAQGLDSGGIEKSIYNVAPVDIANDCVRYYQLSADPRALHLFRELLFRLTDYYLKKPGGACYPADLDFRLGLLVLHFARLEHAPVFDDDDRLILVNLLLACTRTIYEYGLKMWPAKRAGRSRHNHQTFPALSLQYAADYFSRFDLPYINAWRTYSEEIFSGDLWHRSKQCENSRSYEPFVFDHAAASSVFSGHGLTRFGKNCFETMVQRQIVTTDNFFRAVDYGDTGISLHPVDSVSARLLATQQNGIVRWFAGEGFARKPNHLGVTIHDIPGIRLPRPTTPPAAGDWEFVPIDSHFLADVAPDLPPELAFDKLAFRTGWGDEDQYLLLEGVGGEVSHAHHEVNGVVRMNHMGRHWVVSNGYGKRLGITSSTRAFSSRILGPEDHNMLVLRREGKTVTDFTMSALLHKGRAGDVLYATCALSGCGGVNWVRTSIILSNRYLLVIDRIHVLRSGLETAHVEWNCLGHATPRTNGWRLEQQGVFMDVTSASGWRAEQIVADQSACWKGALGGDAYPYASFPLTKLVFHMPATGAGETHVLGTLLAATRGEQEYTIAHSEPGCMVIEGPHPGTTETPIQDRDLELRMGATGLEVRFAPTPELPAGLTCPEARSTSIHGTL